MKENYLGRSQRLFSDWLSTLKNKDKEAVVKSLKEERGVFAYRNLIETMEKDGELLSELFTEIKSDLNPDSKKAKEIFCDKLLEAAEKKDDTGIESYIMGGLNNDGYEYYASLGADYTNQIKGGGEVNNNNLMTSIVAAITGGNMNIAAQLTMAGWGSLSNSDKMSIYRISTVQAGYGKSNVVIKDGSEAKFYTKDIQKSLESGAMNKSDFIDKAFPKTDLKFMKAGSLDKD